MSREHVEIVHEIFDAWNRGDLARIHEYMHPDWEWRTAQRFPGTEAVYRGREGFTHFWNTFREPWETIRVDVERVEDLGDAVLVLQTFYGKGTGSGVEVTTEYANVVTFRDGRVVHQIGYGDWDSALRAVGLEREDAARG